MDRHGPTLERLRSWLMVVVVAGLAGSTADLALLGHFEGFWQVLPLILLVLGLATAIAHWISGQAPTALLYRSAMGVLMACGLAGVYLHFAGNREFQLELNPSIGTGELLLKTIQAHSPPALAPAGLVLLGALGLISTVGQSRRFASGDSSP